MGKCLDDETSKVVKFLRALEAEMGPLMYKKKFEVKFV